MGGPLSGPSINHPTASYFVSARYTMPRVFLSRYRALETPVRPRTLVSFCRAYQFPISFYHKEVFGRSLCLCPSLPGDNRGIVCRSSRLARVASIYDHFTQRRIPQAVSLCPRVPQPLLSRRPPRSPNSLAETFRRSLAEGFEA